MIEIIPPLLEALVIVLAVDFAAGFVHWAEDVYVREDTPWLGRWVGKPNILHHHLPRHMTRNTWWQSNKFLLIPMAVVVVVAWMLDNLTWHVWLFALLGGNANEVHKWSHRTRRENGKIITLLQNLRLLQTVQHHAVHHTNPKDVRYCPVTNLLNPVLDTLRFWTVLEWLLARTIGLRRQPDTSVPGQGPVPDWILEMRKSPSPTGLAPNSPC